MGAPEPFASLSPGGASPVPPMPRNERRRTAHAFWQGWWWPVVGLIAGATAAAAVWLPLVDLPLVGVVTYAQDNVPRATALAVCAGLAALCSLGRWFRPALLGQGMAGGLLLASGLEKWREYQQMRENAHVPAGAGEMTQQYAAAAAKTLAAIRPEIGMLLLPMGCLLGMVAALAGGRAAARRERSA